MKLRAFVGSALLLPCLGLGQLDRVGPPNSNYALLKNPAAVDAGQRRFLQLCSGCHGRNGEGGQGEGQGPNLITSWEVRRAQDRDLFGFIKNGVKGTTMPAFALPDDQIWEMAAFVRSLNAPAIGVPVPGDTAAGEAVFFGKAGCSGCHMILGKGGHLGPDLSNLGATRRLSEIRDAILNPKAEATAGYRPVLLEAAKGSGCAESRGTNRTGPCKCSMTGETCIYSTALRWRRRRFRAGHGCRRRICRQMRCKTCWPTFRAAR